VVIYARSDSGERVATDKPVVEKPGATAWSITPTRGGAFAELRVGF
jgi:hypothetical protein